MLQYHVFDDISQCSEADVSRLLPLVSSQRREQALRYKHLFGQWACLKSYEMLSHLMQANEIDLHSGHYAESNYSSLEFSYNEYGKPYLQIPPIYFSISHCKEAIAVVFSDKEVGIDVESRHRCVSEELIDKVMNEQERLFIHLNETEQQPCTRQLERLCTPQERFIALWTQKEAVLKLRGTGIMDDMKDVLTGNEKVHTEIRENYIYSIATPAESIGKISTNNDDISTND